MADTNTYTARVESLILIAEFMDDEPGKQKAKALRIHSDLMEIIGHPKNPSFSIDKLSNHDPLRQKYYSFQSKFSHAMNEILAKVAEKYGLSEARELAFRVTTLEKTDLSQYLEELFKKDGPTPS